MPHLHQLHIGQLPAINQPALVPYDNSRPIALAHPVGQAHAAADWAEGFALQLLNAHPAGQARLVLFEATPSRQYAHLKRLFAETEGQMGEQLFNSRSCKQQLNALNEQAHRRFALLAAAHAPDLAAYNAQSRRAETTTYLLITDILPLIEADDGLQALKNLCHQGAQVGIVPILLHYDLEKSKDHDLTFRRKAYQAFWREIFPTAFGFDCRQTPPQPLQQPAELWRLFQHFHIELGIAPVLCGQWTDALKQKCQSAQQNNPQSDFLRIPIGLDGVQVAHFSLGDASQAFNAMLGGTTGSGKSNLLNNLIVSACETYSPAELRLWLFDYKNGLEFSCFAGLAHLDALQIDNSQQPQAIAAFTAFEALAAQRSTLFKQENVKGITAYNRKAAQPLPRCVLIIDEFQMLFKGSTLKDSKVAAQKMLITIATQGRAYGLHLILCTQSYQNVEMDVDVKAQFRLRIGLQLANSMACRALMGRDNDALLNLPPYTAAYNNNFGEERDNRLIALDHLTEDDFAQRLAALKQRYPAPVPTFKIPPPSAVAPKSRANADFDDWDRLT
jgi:hypothetical protein